MKKGHSGQKTLFCILIATIFALAFALLQLGSRYTFLNQYIDDTAKFHFVSLASDLLSQNTSLMDETELNSFNAQNKANLQIPYTLFGVSAYKNDLAMSEILRALNLILNTDYDLCGENRLCEDLLYMLEGEDEGLVLEAKARAHSRLLEIQNILLER